MPSRCCGRTTPTTRSRLARSLSASPIPIKLTDEDFEKVKAKLIEQKKLLLSYYAGFDDGVNLFAQNGIKLMYSMGEPQVPALKKKGVNAALTIPKERAVGWLDCWELSAGVKDSGPRPCLDQCLPRKVDRQGADRKARLRQHHQSRGQQDRRPHLWRRLSWLETAENYEKRVATWNEIKAA